MKNVAETCKSLQKHLQVCKSSQEPLQTCSTSTKCSTTKWAEHILITSIERNQNTSHIDIRACKIVNHLYRYQNCGIYCTFLHPVSENLRYRGFGSRLQLLHAGNKYSVLKRGDDAEYCFAPLAMHLLRYIIAYFIFLFLSANLLCVHDVFPRESGSERILTIGLHLPML